MTTYQGQDHTPVEKTRDDGTPGLWCGICRKWVYPDHYEPADDLPPFRPHQTVEVLVDPRTHKYEHRCDDCMAMVDDDHEQQMLAVSAEPLA